MENIFWGRNIENLLYENSNLEKEKNKSINLSGKLRKADIFNLHKFSLSLLSYVPTCFKMEKIKKLLLIS